MGCGPPPAAELAKASKLFCVNAELPRLVPDGPGQTSRREAGEAAAGETAAC
jgi:hypothetical protein